MGFGCWYAKHWFWSFILINLTLLGIILDMIIVATKLPAVLIPIIHASYLFFHVVYVLSNKDKCKRLEFEQKMRYYERNHPSAESI